jgi:hypothetical protein
MAILETLEGDTMEPEILNAGAFGANMARASLKAWEPTMADVLHRKPKRSALTSGIPAKLRAAAANKGTATHRPVRRIPARGAAGARPWGQSSGRFVMVGDDFDPESLEGWLTSAVKGVKKAASAVGSVGSAIVRPVASVGLNVFRSTAPIAGTVIGSAAQSSGILGPLASAFGMGGSTAAAPEGTPAAMPSTGGGIPPIYLIAGGGLLLVLLLRK